MAEQDDFITETDEERARISRRTALKAGVAAGVGTAVWGGPRIGRIGAPPAYGQMCSPPWIPIATTDCESTNCGNGCVDADSIGLNSAPSGTYGTLSVTFTGTCLSGNATDGTVDFVVASGSARVTVEVYDGNPQCRAGNPANLEATVSTPSVVGVGSATLPSVLCSSLSNQNTFYRVLVETNTSTNPLC